jgi:hypothetical protein
MIVERKLTAAAVAFHVAGWVPTSDPHIVPRRPTT